MIHTNATARPLVIGLLTSAISACASLQGLAPFVQPPRFEEATDRRPDIRLSAPSLVEPMGSASIRLWATVHNPNSFGFTLSTLEGTLYLDEVRAAEGEFPLGLPLRAREESTLPLDLSIGLANVPRLASVVSRAASGQSVSYRFVGTIGVDAGRLGTPTFGPATLLTGNFQR